MLVYQFSKLYASGSGLALALALALAWHTGSGSGSVAVALALATEALTSKFGSATYDFEFENFMFDFERSNLKIGNVIQISKRLIQILKIRILIS